MDKEVDKNMKAEDLIGTAVGTVLVVKILETGLKGTGMAYKFPERKKKKNKEEYSDRIFGDFNF
jgi:hypothetical protein